MDKPEGELLLKPLANVTETDAEEHRESDSTNPSERTLSLVEGATDAKPPLAKSETDEDEKPEATTIDFDADTAFLDSERFDGSDTIDLADRAGGFPYAPGFGPGLNGGTITTNPDGIPDFNIYQQKKTVAQGMMDLALFSANANQLRYVLESSTHRFYYPGVVLISLSLIFQVGVGVGLLWNTRYNVKDEKQICLANKVSNLTILGIFLVTVINVFICAFGTTAGAQPAV